MSMLTTPGVILSVVGVILVVLGSTGRAGWVTRRRASPATEGDQMGEHKGELKGHIDEAVDKAQDAVDKA